MGLLQGKRALIVGLASNRSIAFGIAQAMHQQGAVLVFSYQNARLKERVTQLAAPFTAAPVFPCDVADDVQIERLMADIATHWPEGFDIIVHAVAFAPKAALRGNYLTAVNRTNFHIAHDISAYSFAALAKAAKPWLRSNGALLTISYLGGVRTIEHYNVIGLAKAALEMNVRYMARALGQDTIRVNGISAGPIRTLASSGVKDFKKMLAAFEHNAPLKRCVTIEEVGNVTAFLCSNLASGITGEITYVDGGFNTVIAGM